MRDVLLRIGETALEAAVNERRKKGANQEAALPAPGASTTPASSGGARKRS
jgi:hypothetical protein